MIVLTCKKKFASIFDMKSMKKNPICFALSLLWKWSKIDLLGEGRCLLTNRIHRLKGNSKWIFSKAKWVPWIVPKRNIDFSTSVFLQKHRCHNIDVVHEKHRCSVKPHRCLKFCITEILKIWMLERTQFYSKCNSGGWLFLCFGGSFLRCIFS